jgi:hypothetical protein
MQDWDEALAMDKEREERRAKRNLHRRLQTYAKNPAKQNLKAWQNKAKSAGKAAAFILGKG